MSARSRRRQIEHEDFNVSPVPLSQADAELFGAISVADSQFATIREDGRIQVGAFTLTPTGLSSTSEATFEEWQRLGSLLQRLEGSIQWLIGDWFVYGERVWGQTYEQVAEVTGYGVQTLYDYAYVARSVDFSIRIEKLSFSHHRLVAALDAEQQRQWLERATANNLSISQMRKALADTPPALSRGIVDEIAEIFTQDRRRFTKLVKKASGVGEGERAQISQIIDEEIAYLEDLKRALLNE